MINFETGVSKYQQKFKKLFNLQFVSEHSYLLKLSQTLQVCQRQSVFVTDGLYLRQCLSPNVPCQGGGGVNLIIAPHKYVFPQIISLETKPIKMAPAS